MCVQGTRARVVSLNDYIHTSDFPVVITAAFNCVEAMPALGTTLTNRASFWCVNNVRVLYGELLILARCGLCDM